MAYRIEGKEIVIDGWENGISDNPYKGINDMRGVNIISIPGEASLSFEQTSITMPNCTASVVSADAGTDVVTVTITTGGLQQWQAVTFTGASLPTGITAGVTYWINKIDATTFTLYTKPRFTAPNLVNITNTGTGTMATTDMKDITYFEKMTSVALDSAGRTWLQLNAGGSYVYLGNPVSGTTGLVGTAGNGLIWYKGYLFVFYDNVICYLPMQTTGYDGSATWINEWDPVTGAAAPGTSVFNTAVGTHNPHDSLVGINDGVIYITDSNNIASLFEKSGSTFDPATTATYTWAKNALVFPVGDIERCVAELGKQLLIGGDTNAIYTWDRVSTNRGIALLIAESGVKHMITVNTNTYIFAGRRGRIYVTNGSQAQFYTKIPDHISGIEPVFSWENVAYNKNQLYFGVSATDNALNSITSYAGLWAVDITTNALRVPQLQSQPLGTVTAIYANTGGVSAYGLTVAWKYGTTYGIDYGGITPYRTYVAYIDTDIIPIGNYLNKKTFNNIEFKLSQPMVVQSGIKISYRTSRTGSYTLLGETVATVSGITFSDYYPVNFDQVQWIQFRIEMKGVFNPICFVNLYELRIR